MSSFMGYTQWQPLLPRFNTMSCLQQSGRMKISNYVIISFRFQSSQKQFQNNVMFIFKIKQLSIIGSASFLALVSFKNKRKI
jgi:hypothetical protein